MFVESRFHSQLHMTNYFPLADCANVLCTSVDLLVASCNKMAPITVSVRYSFKSITNRLIMTICYFMTSNQETSFLKVNLLQTILIIERMQSNILIDV